MYGDLSRPPLDVTALRRALVTPGSIWTSVDVVAETPSTNALLAAEAAAPDAEGGSSSPSTRPPDGDGSIAPGPRQPRSGITMSALVRPDGVDASYWPWIPLLAGLAVAAAVRHEGDVEASVKWPNDVVVGDRKLAGLLVERVEAGARGPVAVIGIGLNVSLREDELPVPTATSLALAGARPPTARSSRAPCCATSRGCCAIGSAAAEPRRRSPGGVHRRLLDARP